MFVMLKCWVDVTVDINEVGRRAETRGRDVT